MSCSREQIFYRYDACVWKKNLLGMHIMCLHVKCLPAERPAAPCTGAGHERAIWHPQSL